MASIERKKKNPAAEMISELPKKPSGDQQVSQFPSVQEKQRAEADKRLAGLLQGKLEPPNEFVQYLIERFKDARAERDAVVRNVLQMKQRVEALEARRVELEGQSNGYLEDIKKWDKTLVPTPDVAEPKEPDPEPAV